MSYRLNDVKILVVEDMQPMLALTKSILNIFGFNKVYTAAGGDSGYEMFQSEKPDLVITDWLMEPVSGLELIRKIRKSPDSHNPFVPIILMTGFSDRARVELARDDGVTEFLVKPFSAKDIYSRIVQIVEKPRQFVNASDFFGPDRRRRIINEYPGPHRRAEDDGTESAANPEDIILRDLQDTIKNV
jgi:two-component system chemotaxis response regulator CheY